MSPQPDPKPVPKPKPLPLTAANAVGRRVLVPATLYPQYNCSEHGGAGWECLAVAATSQTAKVRFLFERTLDGRPYADERLPLGLLQPL